MSAARHDSATALRKGEVRLDRLLGRKVLARNGRPAGRLEEFRGELHGTGCVVKEFVIGGAGLLERLHVAARAILGLKPTGYLVSWDQIDLSDMEHPRLTCPVDELRQLDTPKA